MRVLLFEPNPHHYEVIPGFAYYFDKMGYEIDCLVQKADWQGDVFTRSSSLKEKINFYYYQKEDWKYQIEELQKLYKYDLLFSTSFDLWGGDHWRNVYKELEEIDHSRLGVVGCYHAFSTYEENRRNCFIPIERIVSLSPVISNEGAFTEVNANYFSDSVDKRPKNQMVRILSIGMSTNRYDLWNTIRDVVKKTKKPVSLICVGRKTQKKKQILKYIIYRFLNIEIPCRYKNWPPLLHQWISKRRLSVQYNASFQILFREVEKADFLDASILPIFRTEFTNNRTSGIKQLSLGFLKPCIIEKAVADYYGFTEKNAIIYEEGNLVEAINRAVCLSDEEYCNMVMEVEKLCNEIRNRSERNLREMFSRLNSL